MCFYFVSFYAAVKRKKGYQNISYGDIEIFFEENEYLSVHAPEIRRAKSKHGRREIGHYYTEVALKYFELGINKLTNI